MKQTTKRTLNNLIEEHLSSIIANSISIARHSKRRRRHITANETSSSSSSSSLAIPTIHASDILSALKINGRPIDLPTNAGYTNNQPIDLNDFLEKESDPQIDTPSELGMVMHWLAVEGVQPNTMLNPVLAMNMAHRDASTAAGGTDLDVGTVSTTKTTTITANPKEQSDMQEINRNDISSNNNNNNNNVTIRNLLPRLLSEELQLYFTRITLALQKQNDTQAQDAALSRLRHDSGIQELIPFFLHFLTPTSNTQLSNVEQSLLRMHCIHAIIQNTNLHLELYLEKIVPLVLNCIVPKKLSWNDYDHWKLRDVASNVLLSLWITFGEKYTSFQSSVIRVLVQAMMMNGNMKKGGGGIGSSSGSAVESRYGALVALSGLGPKVVDAVVLPCIGQFWVESEMLLEKCYENKNDGDGGSSGSSLSKKDVEGRRFALYRLQDALLYTMSVFLGSGITSRINSIDGEKGTEIFGDKLVPFSRNDMQSEYFTCFI